MKFLNFPDLAIIVGVTVLAHTLLAPLYRRIGGSNGA